MIHVEQGSVQRPVTTVGEVQCFPACRNPAGWSHVCADAI